jgi:hypothetical protein
MLAASALLAKLIAFVFAIRRVANKDCDDWRACRNAQIAKGGGSLFFGPGKRI